tara:strand:- start:3485 stop:3667 length:183 start_codon:yes stop_codon:yes gene_type:complete
VLYKVLIGEPVNCHIKNQTSHEKSGDCHSHIPVVLGALHEELGFTLGVYDVVIGVLGILF